MGRQKCHLCWGTFAAIGRFNSYRNKKDEKALFMVSFLIFFIFYACPIYLLIQKTFDTFFGRFLKLLLHNFYGAYFFIIRHAAV